ncbi:hypothetical protein H4K36_27295 [Streptomyces sp. DHE7-1]|nr:hypothetical protein [Streptomyces sp. DHE7-1]
MPNYHEIMTTDLSKLSTAADRWDGMAKEFNKQEIAYKRDVCGVSTGQTWTGLSADAAGRRFDVTLKQFQSAQKEAKAVASLLREAHTQFTDLRKKLESARADAVKAGMAVSEAGVVSYDTSKLSAGERNAMHHDPDYQQSVHSAVASWQAHVDKAVKDVVEADAHVETALKAVVLDADVNDGTLTGFNSHAHSGIDKYVAESKQTPTKPDGWVSDGEAEASGPDVGAEATGPDTGSGKMGEAEAHADLGRASAEGSLTNGPVKLDGEAEAYAGAKGSVSGGITHEGIQGRPAPWPAARPRPRAASTSARWVSTDVPRPWRVPRPEPMPGRAWRASTWAARRSRGPRAAAPWARTSAVSGRVSPPRDGPVRVPRPIWTSGRPRTGSGSSRPVWVSPHRRW